MRVVVIICVFLLSVIASLNSYANNKLPRLNWYADLQIEDIVDQENKAIDSERLQLTMLFDKLSQYYDVHLYSVSIAQGLNFIATQDDLACVSNVIKTKEREKNTHFSAPFSVSLSQQLIFLNDNLKAKQAVHSAMDSFFVDIENLIENNQDIVIGISHGRSYGQYLDEVFSSETYNKKIYVRGSQEKTAGLAQMLQTKRIDYIIEYPYVISHLAASFDKTLKFVTKPIKNIPSYLLSYAACSKSMKGEELLNVLNPILLDLGQSKAYYDNMAIPYSEDTLMLFKQAYDETFY